MALTDWNGVAFRGTAVFVTDDPSDTCSVGSEAVGARATVPGPLGLTCYWTAPASGANQDTGHTINKRLQGVIENSGSKVFVVDGFTPGRAYSYKAAFGKFNAGIASNQGFDLYQGNDGSGSLIDRRAASSMDEGSVMCADGTVLTYANWVTADGGPYFDFTPSGTSVCWFRNNSTFATARHMWLGFQDRAQASSSLLLRGIGKR